MAQLVEPPPPTELTQAPVQYDAEEDEDDDLRTGSSAKIDQLVTLLRLTPDNDKSLVFSQFTSFLDKASVFPHLTGRRLTKLHRLQKLWTKRGELDHSHSLCNMNLLCSIPYVRFDGKMSARRRQETIARFSVPIEGGDVPMSSSQAPTSQPEVPASSQRSSRRRLRSTQAILDESIDDAQDDDFVMDDNQADDDDFIDDSDDEPSRAASKKGKGKAKGKKKTTAPSRTLTPSNTRSDEVNPRVMLISLKAGALGLNLTVANNVYL